MTTNLAVECRNIVKKYPMYKGDFDRLKGLLLPYYKPEEFVALKGIDLRLSKGEILGMIGLNGSGKSTLASIIAGITYADSGDLAVNGKVSMLSASVGMDGYLTGLENIRYKGILLGFSQKEIDSMMQDIIDFADIGKHINLPLRTYSSGMKSRLGFAISVHMDPDILIIDEALSVGDNSFTDKCLAKMNEFKQKGKTILFVRHSVNQMADFCDKVMWLHRGEILGIAEPSKILMPYCWFAREFNAMTNDERENFHPTLEHYQEKYL